MRVKVFIEGTHPTTGQFFSNYLPTNNNVPYHKDCKNIFMNEGSCSCGPQPDEEFLAELQDICINPRRMMHQALVMHITNVFGEPPKSYKVRYEIDADDTLSNGPGSATAEPSSRESRSAPSSSDGGGGSSNR